MTQTISGKAPKGPLDALVRSLDQRLTPEATARLILTALGPEALGSARSPLEAVARQDVRRHFGFSSMSTAFRAVDNPHRQLDKARELVRLFMDKSLPAGGDLKALDDVGGELGGLIGKLPGHVDYARERPNREARARLGLTLSRRRYNKLFRAARRLEAKAGSMRRQTADRELLQIAKASYAHRLTAEDFAGDDRAAAFVAYYSSRMKLRSEFTVDPQQRPFDAASAALLDRCEGRPQTAWWAIAHVFPREDVLAQLSEDQRGRMLGAWFDTLQLIAERLEMAASQTNIDVETMIVKKGNDSSTWNMLAGAWNKARDNWISLVEALGMDGLFDTIMPGKVMRLMAGDVAAWHRSTGGGVHPDTLVWKELPKPWSVMRGDVHCDRAQIEEACRRHRVDPYRSGWAGPRARRSIAEYRPTPELVHGVAVSNPYLAQVLKQAGVFSGKKIKTGWFKLW